MKQTQNHAHATESNAVLSKAVGRASDLFELKNKELASILGLSESSVSRLKKGEFLIEEGSKPWELAVLFLRIFRGLDALMGEHSQNEHAWLRAHNHALGGAPLERMHTVDGMVSTVQYIDAMRAH